MRKALDCVPPEYTSRNPSTHYRVWQHFGSCLSLGPLSVSNALPRAHPAAGCDKLFEPRDLRPESEYAQQGQSCLRVPSPCARLLEP
jgi:hypothetical protein